MGFLYGDNFIFIKRGRIIRPADENQPYDIAMLSDVFGMKIRIASDKGKSWIMPEI
jgi:ABC-type cobalamin/Fe3+-siderophores transport system ATPase subunit